VRVPGTKETADSGKESRKRNPQGFGQLENFSVGHIPYLAFNRGDNISRGIPAMNLTPGGQLNLGKLPLETQPADRWPNYVVSRFSCVIAHT
jgi:hypothetical protein